ncbi:hypothetical protein ACHQM5_008174 [Ranunculus cassubicifolius]
MGRVKISITKIEDRVKRNTTFTKRRTGLFQKAAEYCVLSGAQLAIIVFSSRGTLFSFGHSSVEEIVDRCLNKTVPSPINVKGDSRLATLLDQIREIKEKDKGDRKFWWEKMNLDEDDKSVEELHCLKNSLEKLRENLEKRLNNNNNNGVGISSSSSCSEVGNGTRIDDASNGVHEIGILPIEDESCELFYGDDDYCDIEAILRDDDQAPLMLEF